MENKFKKGLILGGLLAVGAAAGFAISRKEGQKLTKELQEDLKVLAKHLKKNLHQLSDATEESFNQLAAATVEEYAKKKKLAIDVKEKLITALQAKWQEMEKEYSEEKEVKKEEGKRKQK